MASYVMTYKGNNILGSFSAPDNKEAARMMNYLWRNYNTFAKNNGKDPIPREDIGLTKLTTSEIIWRPTK